MSVYYCISVSVVCIYKPSPNLKTKQKNSCEDDSDYDDDSDDRKEEKWKEGK